MIYFSDFNAGGFTPVGPISFVGSGVIDGGGNTDHTYNFSSLLDAGGLQPTLQQGDLVVVSHAVGTNSSTSMTDAKMVPSGYTDATGHIQANDNYRTHLRASYKFMGASPDASFTVLATGAANHGRVTTVHVFRGVDLLSPLDVAAATATGLNTTIPDPPAITPASAGAWILIVGAGMRTNASNLYVRPTELSSVTNHWRTSVTAVGTYCPGMGTGLKTDWTSGAFDCPAYTRSGGSDHEFFSWAAAALALRSA